MADYEYNGLRQELRRNPTVPLTRLVDAGITQGLIASTLKPYEGIDVIAMYTKGRCPNLENNYKNVLLVRGKLLGVNDYELKFDGPGGKTLGGVAFTGSSWEVPVGQLVDVVQFSEYLKNPNPHKHLDAQKFFEFSTITDLVIAEVIASDPIEAHTKLISMYGIYKEDLKHGSTTPVKIISVRDVPWRKTD
jgi:hypothetical protein